MCKYRDKIISFFLSTANLKTKVMQDRITKEKLSYVWEPHKTMRLKKIIKMTRTGSFIPFGQRSNNFDKAEGERLPNDEEIRFFYTAFSVLNFLSLMIRMLSTLLVQGGHLSHGRFISCCQRDKGGSEGPSGSSCISSTLNQNNQQATMPYLGGTY